MEKKDEGKKEHVTRVFKKQILSLNIVGISESYSLDPYEWTHILFTALPNTLQPSY